MPGTPAASYDGAVTIPAELERARHLAFAADEAAARDLLVSLIPAIEAVDRDDLMLEVFAQLGEIYLVRGADDGVAECIRRIRDCLGVYTRFLGGTLPDLADRITMPHAEITHMTCRYARRAAFLDTGLAAARGAHEEAATALAALLRAGPGPADLAGEHDDLITRAHVLCATALCDDDLYAQSVPLWEKVIESVDRPGDGLESTDHRHVTTATAYGRFCVETGRLAEAEPWLRRAGARAEARGWQLAVARTGLERAAASWLTGDHVRAEALVRDAYPAIAHHARAHEVSRCLLYLGLTGMAIGELDYADECFGHAERHWREVGRPLHIHRVLLARSWIRVFRGEFADAVELVAQAREQLDASARHSWLQYARLDDHLGSIWRADALADPNRAAARAKSEQAADLKVPAALAVDSVRYTIADAEDRMRWATWVSAPMLAGAFAATWEWGDMTVLCELIEYHSARGAFHEEPVSVGPGEWTSAATAPVPLHPAAHPPDGGPLTHLGPLPPLRMDPAGGPVLERYRALAFDRYGRDLTDRGAAWATWP